MTKVTLFICCLMTSTLAVFADITLDNIVEDTLTQTPFRAAIWKETYMQAGWFNPTAIHNYFSAVNMKFENYERYALARSGLYTIDLGAGSYSYYFVLLLNENETPTEMIAASGSRILYASGKGRELPISTVTDRLKEAETLLVRHSKLEQRSSLQGAFASLLLAGTLAGIQFVLRPLSSGGVQDPDGDQLLGGISLGFAGVASILAIEAIGEEMQMDNIRKRIRNLWD